MYENFYQKFKSKAVKFSNFETPSPKFAAPSPPIRFMLKYIKIENRVSFLFIKKYFSNKKKSLYKNF